jgi:hypothetical protein
MATDPPNNNQAILDKVAADIKTAAELAKIQKNPGALDAAIEIIRASVPSSIVFEVERLIEKAKQDFEQQEAADKTIIKDRREDQKLADKEQAGRARTEEEKTIDAIYKNFDSLHEEYLKKKQEENKTLCSAIEDMEDGKSISEEHKKKLLKTPEEIEKEKARWKQIELTRKTAETEHEHCSNEIHKINTRIGSLKDHEHKTRDALHQDKDHFVKRQKTAKTKIDETVKHYEERGRNAQLIQFVFIVSEEHNDKAYQAFSEMLHKQFKDQYGVNHAQVGKEYRAMLEKAVGFLPEDFHKRSVENLRRNGPFVLANTDPQLLALVKPKKIQEPNKSKEESQNVSNVQSKSSQLSSSTNQETGNKIPTDSPVNKKVLKQGKKAGFGIE